MFPGKQPFISPANASVYTESDVVFKCEIERSESLPDNYYWYKTNSNDLDLYESSLIRNDQWLTLGNVNASDQGWYWCCIYYNHGGNACSSAYLNVQAQRVEQTLVLPDKKTDFKREIVVVFVLLVTMLFTAFVMVAMFLYKKLVSFKRVQKGNKYMNTVLTHD
jgi:hypothetical protein